MLEVGTRIGISMLSDERERLRQTAVDANEKKIRDDLAKCSCSVVQVKAEGGVPGWSYTVGLFKTFGSPEIIVIGLEEEVALSLLNRVANLLENGRRFHEGDRQCDLLSTVECEFRHVERRWVRHVMGYGAGFYGRDTFPVLQCVYPDLNNRFPWDVNLSKEWRARQPLIFANAWTHVEADFWAANDPESSLHKWKLTLSPHTGVYTTKKIMNDEEPITYVAHDSDDDWQFHGPSESNREDVAFVCLHHILDKDSSLEKVLDLPCGWIAWREDVVDKWSRAPETGE